MADKTFMAQVTHTVAEVYQITAASQNDATLKLGATLAGVEMPGVTKVKETKTMRKASTPRTTVVDPAADAVADFNDDPVDDNPTLAVAED